MSSEEEVLSGPPAAEVLEDRIWVDGCWDFFHHGHAGAMLQARQLGTELYVGIHSDESILENKGPTVMNLAERIAAVEACRWVTKSVPHAPYVTQLPFISHFGCKYVVHGDDITSDSDGGDCYRFVKEAGRFKVVKRTPSISTTDLVGRMLLCTRTHFIKSLQKVLAGVEGHGTEAEKLAEGKAMEERIHRYATDSSGKQPAVNVWFWQAPEPFKTETSPVEGQRFAFDSLVDTKGPHPEQTVVYVDGGYDLFSSGHIEFLRLVVQREEWFATDEGWYDADRVAERLRSGWDCGPVFLVVGIHDDETINRWKGINYPIMNTYERGLCVLQCRHVNAVVFGAPITPNGTFLESLPHSPSVVYHGPTTSMHLTHDPYAHAKERGMYREISQHNFQEVDADNIVQRIMKSREQYEERQRKKGVKAELESAHRQREILEEEQRRKEEERTSA